MEKQFVTYEIALKLKEFGFDEKCFAIYDAYQDNRLVYLCEDGRNPSGTIKTNASMDFSCLAPLWQQCVDWFRRTHNLHIAIKTDYCCTFYYTIYNVNKQRVIHSLCQYKTYEEARVQAILKTLKLIKYKYE